MKEKPIKNNKLVSNISPFFFLDQETTKYHNQECCYCLCFGIEEFEKV
jgi:hypothetical protein